MTDEHGSGWFTFFCPLCGNREATNVATGELAEMTLRTTAAQAAAMVEGARCVYCDTPIEAREVDPPDRRRSNDDETDYEDFPG